MERDRSENPMKELHLTLQIRNNFLRKRRVDLGLTNAGLCRAVGIDQGMYGKLEKLQLSPLRSTAINECRIPECTNVANRRHGMFCKEHKAGSGSTYHPIKRGGKTWRPEIIKLASFYGCEPADLFPPDIWLIEQSTFEKETDSSEVAGLLPPPSASLPGDQILQIEGEAALLDDSVNRALVTLSPLEETVIRKRFGIGMDRSFATKEIADERGVTEGCIEASQVRALEKLRRRARYGVILTDVMPSDFRTIKP